MTHARGAGLLGLFIAAALTGCVPAGGGGGGGGEDGSDPSPDGAPQGADAQTDDGEPRDADPAPDVPPAVPGAPRILSLDADSRRLTEGEALRISAVVTDEDGVDDVLGGVLEDPMGGTYGAFAATGGGTYQVDVDWAALHRTRAIEFVGESQRTLWARFYDQAGLEVVGSLQVTLFCAGGGACDGACRDVLGDTENCGGCDVVCPPVGDGVAACVDGVCGGTCPEGATLCGSTCHDLSADTDHCGGCDRACPAIAGGEAVCLGGECDGRCPDGGLACDGACVDPTADVSHCGDCGNVCPGEAGLQRCDDGRCLDPCAAGESICSGDCVDLMRDPRNCGECDRICDAPPGGEAACVGGACGGQCPDEQVLCEEMCVDVRADVEHCGRCGEVCRGGFDCVRSQCQLQCPPEQFACADRCAECPQDGVIEVGCDGEACVATRCAADRALVDGACVARSSDLIYELPIAEPQPGAYPPVAVDLTFRADGLPHLILGHVSSVGDVFVEAGPRDRNRGWRLSDFSLFESTGRQGIRVGAVALPDGRVVNGFAYDRGDRSALIGGGLRITGDGAPQTARLPGNTGGNLWGFSTAARLDDDALVAQIGISLDNPVNRSMSRYDWQDGRLELVDPFIDGIVHFTLDADRVAHFVYQPGYGGALTWRRGIAFAERVVEPIGEPAALLGGVRVGPRGAVVAYAREPDTQLRVATRRNGRWTFDTVDPADVGGQFWGFDVELDPAGWPVACYWRAGTIYVARQGPDGWTRQRIAAVPGGQTECAVAVDPADGISVAWAHFVTEAGRTTMTLRYEGLAPGAR